MIGLANSVRHIGLDLSRSSESDTVTKRRPVRAFVLFIRVYTSSMQKTYQFITQCKGVICLPFKTAKIIVFDPMKYKRPKVPLQDELPCGSIL